jgi:thiamine-monophosphate kinase
LQRREQTKRIPINQIDHPTSSLAIEWTRISLFYRHSLAFLDAAILARPYPILWRRGQTLGMRSNPTKSGSSGNPAELSLLARIRARAAQAPAGTLQLGIGDDCALLRLRSREELAVTTDLSIDGRHFRLEWQPPDAIGHRTLARGLSDLAAMGARPVAAFLSLGLPGALVQKPKRRASQKASESWLDRFFDGFFALASPHQVPLAGGDLAESPLAIADIVLTGAVRRGKALLRSGARPGHLLYVTGSLGGAAAGFALMQQLSQAIAQAPAAPPLPARLPAGVKAALAPHLYPTPRIAQGLVLARRSLATAAIDLSDGLSTDLNHLCQESGVAAEIDAAALPIHPGATRAQALHGGEDYELLFTAAPAARIPRSIAGVSVTRIGRILRPRNGELTVTLLTERGAEPLQPHGWQHFSTQHI